MKNRVIGWISAAIALVGVIAVFSYMAPGNSDAQISSKAPSVIVAPDRPRVARPVIAVLANNSGTEVTDFMVPYGILSQAGNADVVGVSAHDGPVRMLPALRVQTQETIASFDAAHPSGAAYVIIPALHDRADPGVIAWLRAQAAKGAVLVSICDGTWTLAATGLLDGRRATGHWYSMEKLAKQYPKVTWVRNERYVRDGSVQTSTGVSASIPASLALVEEIAGKDAAARIAARYDVGDWSPAHDRNPFRLTAGRIWTLSWNKILFWSHEKVGIPVEAGVDEVALSLTVDPLSRTYRSQALTIAVTTAPIRTAHGLMLTPDLTTAEAGTMTQVAVPIEGAPLDLALATVQRRYGAGTRDWVATQLEYPQGVGQ